MSFSAQLKGTLSRHVPPRHHCRLAELSAIVRLSGKVDWDDGATYPTAFSVSSTNSAPVRGAHDLMAVLFDQRPTIKISRLRTLGRSHHYAARLAEPAPVVQMLNELGIVGDGLDRIDGIPPRLVREACCRIAYVRGAFMAGGSIADPRNTYHLEVVSESEKWARDFLALLGRLEIRARLSRRKHSHVIYMKESGQIAAFLALIGSHSRVLELEELMIRRQMRNEVNRLVNCDSANARKTADASHKQLADIELLEKARGLESLPPGLRMIAAARRAAPDATLAELGEAMHPPLSKSAVAHRLRRLSEMAYRLQPTE